MCKIEKFRNFVLAKREAPPSDPQTGAVKLPTTRKDAGVVDRDGLENRCTVIRTEGSNPSLSANKGVNQQAMRFTPFIIPKKFLGISTDPGQ